MTDLSLDVDPLAKLARLTLSAEEKEQFASQLPEILEFVNQLSVVAKVSTEESITTVPLAKLRADEESGSGLTLEELEKLAPAWRNNQVEVPAVFQD